jgi:hypothetical protein
VSLHFASKEPRQYSSGFLLRVSAIVTGPVLHHINVAIVDFYVPPGDVRVVERRVLLDSQMVNRGSNLTRHSMFRMIGLKTSPPGCLGPLWLDCIVILSSVHFCPPL